MIEGSYKNTPVKFFYRDVPMTFLSKQANRPITEKREFISIMKPGHSGDIMEREVSALDKERWGSIYENWKNNTKEILEGTMLETLPGIDEHKISLCKGLNIFTLEQLISIDEGGIKNLGFGARELVIDAKKYLQGISAVGEMEEEIADLKAENQELREKIDDLTNNGTERSKRNTASSSTVDSNRKRRRICNTVPVTDNESGTGAASAAQLA